MSTETPGTLRLWLATAVVSVSALALGVVGYACYLTSGPGARSEFAAARPVDLLYYTLQLFVLGPSPFGGPPYGAPLSLAMFLAPLATVLAVVATVSTAFRERLTAWRVRRRPGNTVVVGTTPEAFVLAGRLAERRPRPTPATWRTLLYGRPGVVLVGTGVDPGLAGRHAVRVVRGEPTDEATLRAAGVGGAVRVFALARSGAVNAAVAIQVRSLHSRTVEVHARVENPELVAAMRARRLGAEGDRGFRVDFFSLETVAALALFDLHPPRTDAVIVGTDPFARAIHQELVRRRRQARRTAPGPLVPCEDADGLPPAGSTYVCDGDPDEVLRIGLDLLLAGHPHVVLCLGRRSALAGALEPRLFDRVLGQLSVFGTLDAACDPDRLTGNALVEQLARALHKGYLDEYAEPGSTQESHRPWEELAERFKADNREHAEDIGAKLADVGAIIVPATERLPPFRLTDEEVEDLAQREHLRWMAGKPGVLFGEERTATTHPDMREWDDGLTDAAKEKDRMFVRRLPALLAAEDLAIVRRAGS